MRNVCEVVNNMMDYIPDEHNMFKKELYDLISSIRWASPEKVNSSYYWNSISIILSKYITEDDYNKNEWCNKVISIFQGKEN